MKKTDKLLLAAIARGDAAAAAQALKNGADPNIQVEEGLPAFHVLIATGQTELVKVFLEAGARPDETDWLGATPLMWAASTGDAAGKDDAFDLLLRAGADVNGKSSDGRTPLGAALAFLNYPMAKRLIDAGAQPTAAQRERIDELFAKAASTSRTA